MAVANDRVEVPRGHDLALLFAVFFLVAGAMWLEQQLLAGDWSFWTDWKDRQWWPLTQPALNMIVAAAVHYLAWRLFRLPIGATLAAVALSVAAWFGQLTNFTGWVYYPVNFVWPNTFIPAAILVDVLIMLTRSWLLTGLFGGLLWGLLFVPENWVPLVPFRVPVELAGYLLTVADVQGMQYLRAQTPEYLRIVETGSLRAFLEQSQYVVAIFAGTVCVATYWVGQLIGRFLAMRPIKKVLTSF